MKGIEEILQTQKVFVGKTQGDSMLPMLREGKDTVVVSLPTFPLKRYDVPVYRRDGHYTMHRIVWVRKNGYIICGDNRWRPELDIKDHDIIGVLTGFYRDGQFISCEDEGYLSYAKKVCRKLPMRMLKGIVKRIFKK